MFTGKWYYEVTVDNVGGLGRSSAFQLFDAENDGDEGGRIDSENNFEPTDISDKNKHLPPIGGCGSVGFVTEEFFGEYDRKVGVGHTRNSWSISGANPTPDDGPSGGGQSATARYEPWVEVRHNTQRLAKQNIEPLRFPSTRGDSAGIAGAHAPASEEVLTPHEFELKVDGPDQNEETDATWQDGDRRTTVGCAVSISPSTIPRKLEIRIEYYIKHIDKDKVCKVSASRRESPSSPGMVSHEQPEELVSLINDDDVLIPAVSLHPNLKLTFNFGEKTRRGLPNPEYAWVVAAVSSSTLLSSSAAASGSSARIGGDNTIGAQADLSSSAKHTRWKQAELQPAIETLKMDAGVSDSLADELAKLGESGRCTTEARHVPDGTLLSELFSTKAIRPEEALRLDHSPPLKRALATVTDFLQFCPHKVRAISADACNLSAGDVVPLSQFLEDDVSVQAISLDANILLVDGAARLAEVLRHNSTITALNLSGNMIAGALNLSGNMFEYTAKVSSPHLFAVCCSQTMVSVRYVARSTRGEARCKSSGCARTALPTPARSSSPRYCGNTTA